MKMADRCGGVGAGVDDRAEARLVDALELGYFGDDGQQVAE